MTPDHPVPALAPRTRRAWFADAAALVLRTAGAAAVLPTLARAATPVTAPTPITVYKDPSCGCCQKWIAHVAGSGFRPAVQDVEDMDALKDRLGVPGALRSCHTAVVGGYLVEGHVPAADVQRLLRERPAVRGLAAPGMPAGSPGMEMGGRADRYDVVAFTADGKTRRFAAH